LSKEFKKLVLAIDFACGKKSRRLWAHFLSFLDGKRTESDIQVIVFPLLTIF